MEKRALAGGGEPMRECHLWKWPFMRDGKRLPAYIAFVCRIVHWLLSSSFSPPLLKLEAFHDQKLDFGHFAMPSFRESKQKEKDLAYFVFFTWPCHDVDTNRSLFSRC